ncbi:MAG: hypothetical protein WD278_02970, partial [Pirellulales bacterium]
MSSTATLTPAPPGHGGRQALICSPGDDTGPGRGLVHRCASAVGRRMARAWRLLTIGDTGLLIPGAVAQLRSIAGAGSAGHCGASACPGHLGHALSVLVQYGQWDAARPACRRLLATQWGDGSFADPGRRYAAVASTAQAVRGLLDIEQNLSPPLAAASPQVDDPALVHDIEAAARRACDYLARHADPLRTPGSIPAGPPEMALAALPCLALAARRLHV